MSAAPDSEEMVTAHEPPTHFGVLMTWNGVERFLPFWSLAAATAVVESERVRRPLGAALLQLRPFGGEVSPPFVTGLIGDVYSGETLRHAVDVAWAAAFRGRYVVFEHRDAGKVGVIFATPALAQTGIERFADLTGGDARCVATTRLFSDTRRQDVHLLMGDDALWHHFDEVVKAVIPGSGVERPPTIYSPSKK